MAAAATEAEWVALLAAERASATSS